MRAIFIKSITLLLEYAVFLALFGIVIILSINVFLRYIVHRPFSWAEELSILFLVWIVLLGAGLVQKKDEHVAITYLFDVFSPKVKKIFLFFANLCITLVLIIHLISGWNLVKLQMKSSMLGMNLPMGLFALGVLVGVVGMLIYTVHSTVESLTKNRLSKH